MDRIGPRALGIGLGMTTLGVIAIVLAIISATNLRVELFYGGIGTLLVFGGILIARSDDLARRSTSTITVAKVIELYTKTRDVYIAYQCGGALTVETTYFITVHFLADGESVRLKSVITRRLFRSLRTGGDVRMRYANANPRKAIFEGEFLFKILDKALFRS